MGGALALTPGYAGGMKPALRPFLAAAALAAALGLTACGGAGGQSVVGTWGDPEATGTPSLTFLEDGSYAGTDGCNQVGGSWSADGDTIDLGAMRSTMMYCEGVDTWLTGATSARIADGELDFLDEAGAAIGSLSPAKK